MNLLPDEILETIDMVEMQHLDVLLKLKFLKP